MQIVGVTVAFCIGVNRAGIHQVIHFGCPSDLDSYIQETGHVDCYGSPTIAVLLHLPCTIRHVDKSLVNMHQISPIAEGTCLSINGSFCMVARFVNIKKLAGYLYSLFMYYEPLVAVPFLRD